MRCTSYAQSIWIFFILFYNCLFYLSKIHMNSIFGAVLFLLYTDFISRYYRKMYARSIWIFFFLCFIIVSFTHRKYIWIRFLFVLLIENSYMNSTFDPSPREIFSLGRISSTDILERRCAPSFINKFSNHTSGSLFRPPLLRRAYKRIVTRMTKEGKKRGRSAGTAVSMSVILLNWSAFE